MSDVPLEQQQFYCEYGGRLYNKGSLSESTLAKVLSGQTGFTILPLTVVSNHNDGTTPSDVAATKKVFDNIKPNKGTLRSESDASN